MDTPTYRYQYTGEDAQFFAGIGLWQPQEIKELDARPNHPLLQPVAENPSQDAPSPKEESGKTK